VAAALVALDLQVDTTTPAGEMLANVVLSTAQYERRLIGERTKAGLQAAVAKGVVLGRRQSLSIEVVRRIVVERAAGSSLPAIARGLAADGVPTAQGGATWHPSTIAASVGAGPVAGVSSPSRSSVVEVDPKHIVAR